eukprot:828412-Rhodomonas_salina.1
MLLIKVNCSVINAAAAAACQCAMLLLTWPLLLPRDEGRDLVQEKTEREIMEADAKEAAEKKQQAQ